MLINQPSCPLPALLTPFPVIVFVNEEATDYISEEAVGAILGAIITGRNPVLFFISCFTVSLAPSINTPGFSSDYDFNNIIHIFIQS